MKRVIITACILAILGTQLHAKSFKKTTVELKTTTDSLSYALGNILGTSLRKNFSDMHEGIDFNQFDKAYTKAKITDKVKEDFSTNFDSINTDILNIAFVKGLCYADSSVFTTDKADEYLRNEYERFQAKNAAKEEAEQQKLLDENMEQAKAFLAKNAKRDGVHTTESGLQYEILKEGNGEIPTTDASVMVHYTGTTIDGEVFDSSIERGEPVTFPVTGVIDGWTEALQLMPVGSKWRIYLPPSLAYGERGAGEAVEPNSALIFEIELLSIK